MKKISLALAVLLCTSACATGAAVLGIGVVAGLSVAEPVKKRFECGIFGCRKNEHCAVVSSGVFSSDYGCVCDAEPTNATPLGKQTECQPYPKASPSPTEKK